MNIQAPLRYQDVKRQSSAGLAESLSDIAEKCVDCALCVKECAFLTRHGSPREIASMGASLRLETAYECSLCGLCTAVCPVGLDPAGMFLNMRRESVKTSGTVIAGHRRILAYERRGMSRRYTHYAIPKGCGSVFFPGCTLPGTRPETTLAVYEQLKKLDSSVGIVLDCCGKPSHDLGHTDHFTVMFNEMADFLRSCGIRQIITACPNCHVVFSGYGDSLQVKTVYEVLAASESLAFETGKQEVEITMHDPCVLRFDNAAQTAARGLLAHRGIDVKEMAHSRKKTVCCGEGGAVGFVLPEHSESWGEIRKTEAAGRTVVTYCAGCAGKLQKYVPSVHLLDVIFKGDAALAGNAKVSRPPLTYWNRIRLKQKLKKDHPAPVTRERPFISNKSVRRTSAARKGLLLSAVVALMAGFHLAGGSRLLEAGALGEWVNGFGPWAPVVFIMVYTVAPALFLPGLPLTIAGGLLFGPVWGVVYTITGATAGASLAFLIARYIARDWVLSKLSNPRWDRLHAGVEAQGWKIVAFTRLIPLFPFNLLNYAFGVTRIPFLPYAAASFICMLPACIAYIVFSSSLPDLLAGNLSPGLITGIALILGVSAIPLIYRRLQAKKVSLSRQGRRPRPARPR